MRHADSNPGKLPTLRFNLMVVGENRQGKMTLLKSLFSPYVENLDDIFNENAVRPSMHKSRATVDVEEVGSFKLHSRGACDYDIHLFRSREFGDFLNNTYAVTQLSKDLLLRHHAWSRLDHNTITEQERNNADTRIHCALYALHPHSLRSLDAHFFISVSHLVNIVPVITKADTMTMSERAKYLEEVQGVLLSLSSGLHNPIVFDFRENDEELNCDQTSWKYELEACQEISKPKNNNAAVPTTERASNRAPSMTFRRANEQFADFIPSSNSSGGSDEVLVGIKRHDSFLRHTRDMHEENAAHGIIAARSDDTMMDSYYEKSFLLEPREIPKNTEARRRSARIFNSMDDEFSFLSDEMHGPGSTVSKLSGSAYDSPDAAALSAGARAQSSFDQQNSMSNFPAFVEGSAKAPVLPYASTTSDIMSALYRYAPDYSPFPQQHDEEALLVAASFDDDDNKVKMGMPVARCVEDQDDSAHQDHDNTDHQYLLHRQHIGENDGSDTNNSIGSDATDVTSGSAEVKVIPYSYSRFSDENDANNIAASNNPKKQAFSAPRPLPPLTRPLSAPGTTFTTVDSCDIRDTTKTHHTRTQCGEVHVVLPAVPAAQKSNKQSGSEIPVMRRESLRLSVEDPRKLSSSSDEVDTDSRDSMDMLSTTYQKGSIANQIPHSIPNRPKLVRSIPLKRSTADIATKKCLTTNTTTVDRNTLTDGLSRSTSSDTSTKSEVKDKDAYAGNVGNMIPNANEATITSATNQQQTPSMIYTIPNIFSLVCTGNDTGVRHYPWGTLCVWNPKHSDLRRLQQLLFESGKISELRAQTQEYSIQLSHRCNGFYYFFGCLAAFFTYPFVSTAAKSGYDIAIVGRPAVDSIASIILTRFYSICGFLERFITMLCKCLVVVFLAQVVWFLILQANFKEFAEA